MPKRLLDILHFLSETWYTKYGVAKLDLLVDNIELWDPTQNEESSGRRGLESVCVIARSNEIVSFGIYPMLHV